MIGCFKLKYLLQILKKIIILFQLNTFFSDLYKFWKFSATNYNTAKRLTLRSIRLTPQ